MDTPPSWLMPRKRCGLETDCRALIATVRPPSVPFLKPTDQDKPEAISRRVCDSVVRAPMADQLIRPFQPTVVRGFSKYARITRYRLSEASAASALRRSAYSWAALISWIEHA